MKKMLVAAALAAFAALASGCIHPDRTGPDKSAQPVIPEKIVFLCGTTPVIFNAPEGRARMDVAGESFDLKPAVSASGARYRAVDGSETGFWSKGERALVTVRGRELPECRALREPELPFTARGQEPGWMIRIDADTIFLNADFGALQLRMPKTEPLSTAEGFLYRSAAEGRRLAVAIRPEICADVATGMPHPFRVRYELDGKAHAGCGGNPRSLLTGLEWIVETIGGVPVVEKSKATILFLEEGRVAGNASCNRFTGSYRLTGEGLSFGQMANTRMACEEPLNSQEMRLLELLQKVHRFEIGPQGRLVLHTPDGQRITARR
ncbi:MAG: META domain-containing protein [Desulfobacteraceae bacterium]|jgi:heat shock protein HslJ/membrane-bound inhibitor of C-type lysozyme|nr:META domain-containing protein [Desulfobacteraceae bacterium]